MARISHDDEGGDTSFTPDPASGGLSVGDLGTIGLGAIAGSLAIGSSGGGSKPAPSSASVYQLPTPKPITTLTTPIPGNMSLAAQEQALYGQTTSTPTRGRSGTSITGKVASTGVIGAPTNVGQTAPTPPPSGPSQGTSGKSGTQGQNTGAGNGTGASGSGSLSGTQGTNTGAGTITPSQQTAINNLKNTAPTPGAPVSSNGIVNSIWDGFTTALSWLWNNVGKPLVGLVGAFLKPVAGALGQKVANQINPPPTLSQQLANWAPLIIVGVVLYEVTRAA